MRRQKSGNARQNDQRMECDRRDYKNMHPYDRLREGISADPITAHEGFRDIQEQMLSDETEPKAWAEHKRRYPEQFDKIAVAAGATAISGDDTNNASVIDIDDHRGNDSLNVKNNPAISAPQTAVA